MLCDIVGVEANRIKKSKEAHDLIDISYKRLSEAAVCRVAFWLKRIATFVTTKSPVLPVGHTDVPKKMQSALKKYVCSTDAQAQDSYYLFKEMLLFLFQNYSPKNKLSTTLTVDCVDQSVMDPNGPMYRYIHDLMTIRSRPELNRSCKRT